MNPPDLDELLGRELQRRREAHLLRERQIVDPVDGAHVVVKGQRYVNFASNDTWGCRSIRG